MTILNVNTAKVVGACYDWMHVCGILQNDPLSFDNIQSPDGVAKEFNRLDIPYPLEWLESHVANMNSLNLELEQVVDECVRRIENKINFRCSTLKKNPELQSLPIDLLGQLLINNAIDRDDETEKIRVPTTTILDNITCGAITVHSRKSKKGGLFGIETTLETEKKELLEYLSTLSTLAGGRSSVEYLIEQRYYDEIIQKALHHALAMESEFIEASHRKILCISQALSVVVNGFIMKLNLVAEGYILPSFAESWAKHGLLVYFEGLLSVQGKERIMLEDSLTAIESLNCFHFRILPQVETSTSSEDCVKIHVSKREISLYLGIEALRKLPSVYSTQACSGGLVINLVAVLFTQGIDFMQSVATTFASGSSDFDLQKHINFKSVMLLNKHSWKVQSVETSEDQVSKEEHIHPMLRELFKTIQFTSTTEKDVQLLYEAEEVCEILGGLNITFCKSGKDRTGMAITLQQARYVGERFGCGSSDEMLLKNANVMRVHGTRLDVTKKNIGKKIYSFNSFQCQFLPPLYRPPAQVQENILKTNDTS